MKDKLKSNKGGSLIEVILILTIVFSLSFIWIKPKQFVTQHSKAFISSVIHTQVMALYLRENLEVITDTPSEYTIRFNSSGNVNISQTISLGNKKVIIMLGTGRIHEKRIFDD